MSQSEPKGRFERDSMSLEEAFDYGFDPSIEGALPRGCRRGESGARLSEVNLERAIRAVGLLLHHLSEDGNRTVTGFVALGLGIALSEIADDAAFRRIHYDLDIVENMAPTPKESHMVSGPQESQQHRGAN